MRGAPAKLFRLVATRGPAVLVKATLGAGLDACRRRQFHIAESSSGGCGFRTVWRWPTRLRFLEALHRRLGLSQIDFRRRANSVSGIEELPPDVRPATSVLLAATRALTDDRVRQFIQSKAARGELHLAYPYDRSETTGARLTVLSGVEADAEGQACLRDLRRRGISCDWLAPTEEAGFDDVPLREACARQAIPAKLENSLEYAPVAVPQGLTFHRATAPAQRRPRVLTYRWHVPHQYELFKLGADFTLVSDLGEGSCGWWDLGQRPLPANARFVRWRDIDPSQFDLAILHFDENVLTPSQHIRSLGPDWGKTFRFLHSNLSIPRIAVCHGTTRPGDGDSGASANREALVEFLGDTMVVINSHQAQSDWGFRRSHVIWQGFDPDEFPARPFRRGRAPRILTLPQEALAERPECRGASLLERVAARVPVPLERLDVPEPNLLLGGNAYAKAKFAHYIAALHAFDIYFNPTLHSPMPRSRGEAMLCGLATVNADGHDVDRFIENGVNGFYASTAAELADQLQYLVANPEATRQIGQAARETAKRLFHIERYLSDWRKLVRDALGSDAI